MRPPRTVLTRTVMRRTGAGVVGCGRLTRLSDPPAKAWLWWLAPLVAVLLLLWWLWPKPADTLTQLHLSGARSPACVRLVILPDRSGSMEEFAAARDGAFAQLIPWATANLRADDELAVIDWAASAAVAAGPARVDQVADGSLPSVAVETDGTDLTRAVDAVVAMPGTTCRTALVFLTDTAVSPVADQTIRSLVDATVTSVTVVLPDGASVTSEWTNAMPFSRTVTSNARDADATARALGQAVAFATDQQLSVTG